MMKKNHLFSVAGLGILLVCGFACAQENSTKETEKKETEKTEKANSQESTETADAGNIKPALKDQNIEDQDAKVQSEKSQEEISPAEIKRVSEAFGHFLGRNLKTPGINFDLETMIKGMREGCLEIAD